MLLSRIKDTSNQWQKNDDIKIYITFKK